LFHHGLPERSQLLTADGRAWLARVELPAVARQAVELALRMIDHLECELDLLDTELARIARAQPGCKALQRRYGIGWLTAVAIWAEFGDVRRFANSRQAVRFTGLDITIADSDGKRARGASGPSGISGAALGVTRGGHVRRPAVLARPRLLALGQAAAGWQAGCAVGGPQAGPRGVPHPARAQGPALVPAELPTAA
jgi:transposase